MKTRRRTRESHGRSRGCTVGRSRRPSDGDTILGLHLYPQDMISVFSLKVFPKNRAGWGYLPRHLVQQRTTLRQPRRKKRNSSSRASLAVTRWRFRLSTTTWTTSCPLPPPLPSESVTRAYTRYISTNTDSTALPRLSGVAPNTHQHLLRTTPSGTLRRVCAGVMGGCHRTSSFVIRRSGTSHTHPPYCNNYLRGVTLRPDARCQCR